MAELRPKYRCTESELYSITNLAITNLETDLPDFAAKKAKYIPAFVTNLEAMRTSAMALPGEEQRNADHETLKGLLPNLTNNLTLIVDQTKSLKSPLMTKILFGSCSTKMAEV